MIEILPVINLSLLCVVHKIVSKKNRISSIGQTFARIPEKHVEGAVRQAH